MRKIDENINFTIIYTINHSSLSVSPLCKPSCWSRSNVCTCVICGSACATALEIPSDHFNGLCIRVVTSISSEGSSNLCRDFGDLAFDVTGAVVLNDAVLVNHYLVRDVLHTIRSAGARIVDKSAMHHGRPDVVLLGEVCHRCGVVAAVEQVEIHCVLKVTRRQSLCAQPPARDPCQSVYVLTNGNILVLQLSYDTELVRPNSPSSTAAG